MQTETRTLLTVITEANLEPTLLRTLTREGLRGYTITDARGRGEHGERNASWSESGNIRLEAICSREQAERLLAHLQSRYYPDYAMIAFLQPVEIVRPEKF
ncbi:P-II family nitrogen regulator [Aeromonas veronii]|uniref:P-II family nitrogen regulator n=1 Tax=Aeromonas veronii TaxID=654 RepID=UPI0015D01A0F|nr:transcriptional regulator [Aeromonas veronii]QLH65002.1 transcriptional regulator [Aeromonas veronii]WFO51527.1 transcriptional regulator [Aeromonas veronii]